MRWTGCYEPRSLSPVRKVGAGVAVVSGLEGMVVLVWESSLRKGSPELRPAWGGIAVS